MKWEIIKEASPPSFEDDKYYYWVTPNIFDDTFRVYAELKQQNING